MVGLNQWASEWIEIELADELKSNWKMDMWLEWSLSGYGKVYGMKSSVHVSKVES